MPRRHKTPKQSSVAAHVLEPPESSVLDLLDSLLNKGVMANGEVTLGVAGIDLIYLRLSSILCAADRVMPLAEEPPRKRRPKHKSRR